MDSIFDCLLLSYDSAGNFYQYHFIDIGELDEGYGITLDESGNIYIVGYLYDYIVSERILLLKFGIDTDGDGYSDWAESTIYFTDPNNPFSSPFMNLFLVILFFIVIPLVIGLYFYIRQKKKNGTFKSFKQFTSDHGFSLGFLVAISLALFLEWISFEVFKLISGLPSY